MAYLKYRLDRSSLETIYKSFIRPILEYGDIMLNNMTDEQATLIEQLNKRAGGIISGATRGTKQAQLQFITSLRRSLWPKEENNTGFVPFIR